MNANNNNNEVPAQIWRFDRDRFRHMTNVKILHLTYTAVVAIVHDDVIDITSESTYWTTNDATINFLRDL